MRRTLLALLAAAAITPAPFFLVMLGFALFSTYGLLYALIGIVLGWPLAIMVGMALGWVADRLLRSWGRPGVRAYVLTWALVAPLIILLFIPASEPALRVMGFMKFGDAGQYLAVLVPVAIGGAAGGKLFCRIARR